MVKIRLRRVGAKKQPSYRVVVADSRSPRDGRFIEVIGFYNPRTEPETVTIKEDRALHWLGVGAQPTPAVERLLVNQGTLARLERLKKGEMVNMCGMCMSYGSLMQQGAKWQEIDSDNVFISVMYADDPVVVEKIHMHTDRTNDELRR